MNSETFLQYITRKTGMGRTGWFMAILIHAIAVLYVFYTVANYPEPGWWVPLAFAVGIAAIVWGGTYGNYRLDRARTSKPPNQNHYDDVCEGCDPVMYKNRKPIKSVSVWYAATRKVSREDAEHTLYSMSAADLALVFDEYDAYLDNFPKP
jgi:hypothetical protein